MTTPEAAGGSPKTGDSITRPLGVSILVFFLVLSALGGIITGARSGNAVSAYLDFYQSVLSALISWGSWKGKGWSWVLLVFTSVVGVVFLAGEAVLGLSSFPSLIGLGLDVLFIVYALRKSVRLYFGIDSILSELT